MCTDCSEINGAQVPTGNTGPAGSNGTNGADGVSISSAVINEEGNLIITLTNGTTLNAGSIRGINGADGATGPTGDTGPAGVGTITTLTGDAVATGASTYDITLAETSWVVAGEFLFVEDAGHYLVTGIDAGTGAVSISDPGYSTNDASQLLSGNLAMIAGAAGPEGPQGDTGEAGFMYETVDGNDTPAEANGPNQILMRNADDTGYVFVSLEELIIMLNTIQNI